MSFDRIHQCPRCELRFEYRGELDDHLRHDHEGSGIVSDAHRDAEPLIRGAEEASQNLRILVSLDPTRPAMPAADIGAALARRVGGLVEFVSVTSPGLPAKVVDSFLDAEVQRHRDVVVTRRRLEGESVVRTLLEHISATTPDAVVLASHGRGPIGETLLGSVSSDLVRSSSSPTLLIGPHCVPLHDISELIVAVDGSHDAQDALGVALALAPRLRVPLRLVEVATEPLPRAAVETDDLRESSEVQRIASSVDPPIGAWDVLHGHDISSALVTYAESIEGSVLVLGTHGRSPGRPRVLGGVAGRTVRHSTGPVLTVSPEACPREIEVGRTQVRQPTP